LPQFSLAPDAFFDYLARFRFTVIYLRRRKARRYLPESRSSHRAPIIEAQIPETYVLAAVGFQSMIATKAARAVEAAAGRDVVEFGTRRAILPKPAYSAGARPISAAVPAPATP